MGKKTNKMDNYFFPPPLLLSLYDFLIFYASIAPNAIHVCDKDAQLSRAILFFFNSFVRHLFKIVFKAVGIFLLIINHVFFKYLYIFIEIGCNLCGNLLIKDRYREYVFLGFSFNEILISFLHKSIRFFKNHSFAWL